MLKETEERFLSAFSKALKGEKYPLSAEDREGSLRFFDLAKSHKIMPLITDSLEDPSLFPHQMKRARMETQTQARRTADFVLLYDYLNGKGLFPLVLKGIICRSLYPHPEQRPSSDEDLWIDAKDFAKIHEALTSYGLTLVDPDQDIEKDFEVAYTEKESLLYIEVHKTLFPTDSVYSYLNDFFKDARERETIKRIFRTDFHTLSDTDHLLYLIFHAYKHFLHSGFGIRQVSDILLYSFRYRETIDWKTIREDLEKAKAFDFTRALYKIGLKDLLYDEGLSVQLKDWEIDAVDEMPLLEDIMASGIYGASSFTRLHTSTMTLNALEKKSVISSVFPPLKSMTSKYPYLKKKPYLLPVAWTNRIVTYLKRTKTIADNDPQESLRLGKERIGLLKQYHILDEDS